MKLDLVEELEHLSSLQSPSVESLLCRSGYVYEASVVKRVIAAFNESRSMEEKHA